MGTAKSYSIVTGAWWNKKIEPHSVVVDGRVATASRKICRSPTPSVPPMEYYLGKSRLLSVCPARSAVGVVQGATGGGTDAGGRWAISTALMLSIEMKKIK